SMGCGVIEERRSDAFPDPVGLDPEILEPAHLALRNERAPPDRPAGALGDEYDQLAEALRREVAAIRPLAHLLGLVSPMALRRDRDLPQARTFVRFARAHHDNRLLSHCA